MLTDNTVVPTGTRLKCIDDSGRNPLVLNKVYTVVECYSKYFKIQYTPHRVGGYYKTRFIIVEEGPYLISF